ncbi:MAG TPA: dolichyl-phosphate beta-glucosyltransferase [Acidobacteriota bacterium]|nr:dolichyl-phosphate beta-glucosyltransferase [Acidobacteriota bacterium]
MGKRLSVEIVIPVYNEEEALGLCIDRLRGFLSTEFDHDWQIIIANNGSTDRTVDVALKLSAADNRVRLLNLKQKGRGLALRSAWSGSSADVVSYMDVDLSTNLRYFPLLVEGLRCGYDIAIGSRLMQASMVARRFKREILSRGFNLLIRLLFHVRFSDAQCGFKALRGGAAQRLLPFVVNNGWFFDAELLILAEKNRFRIFEAPIEWMEDLDSRVNLWGTAMEDLRGLARMRTRRLNLNLDVHHKADWRLMETTRLQGKAGKKPTG